MIAGWRDGATFAGVLLTCQSGFETLLARELEEIHGARVTEKGPGWVLIDGGAGPGSLAGAPGVETGVRVPPETTFAHLSLFDPVERKGESVNGLASQVADFFLTSLHGERVEAPWANVWQGPAEFVGLGRRISAVAAAFDGLLKKKLSRVAKLATSDLPRGAGPVRGLFVFFADFGRVFVAREAFAHGQRRMADDERAPSRSYLKVEEAFIVLGREPLPGETVCDLGAAPGGWSYSAAKRGARVLALDNGPLKGGAADHPQIEHRREDAFGYRPSFAKASEGTPSFPRATHGTPSFGKAEEGTAAVDETFDWLFCDLVEEPHHVLRNIVEPWLARGWCRRFIVNLKFGRVDPIGLLRELRAPGSPLVVHAPGARIRQLYHDREEFTVVGEVVARGRV